MHIGMVAEASPAWHFGAIHMESLHLLLLSPVSGSHITDRYWYMMHQKLHEVNAACMQVIYYLSHRYEVHHHALLTRTAIARLTSHARLHMLHAGDIYIIDEVHTPDSSRYWLAGSYEARHAAAQEPENIDKEFLRLWFRAR